MFLFLSLFLFSFLLIEGPALSTKFNKNRIHSSFDTQCQVSIVSSPAATVVAAAIVVAAATVVATVVAAAAAAATVVAAATAAAAATVVAAAATVVAAAAHCDLVTHSLNEGIVCVGVM